MTASERQKEYREENWDRVRAIERRSHEKNADKREAYRRKRWAENGENLREYYRNYFKANRDKRKATIKRHYEKHREKILANGRNRYHANPEYEKKKRDIYYANNKEKKLETSKRCRENNREKYRAMTRRWKAEQRKSNPTFRIVNACRSKIRIAIRRQQVNKSARSIDLIGCSWTFFRDYLERQFTDQMTWKNYRSYWNIDHIIPVSKFDLSKSEQQKKAFHYSNCRPMISVDNFRKNNAMPGPHQPLLL